VSGAQTVPSWDVPVSTVRTVLNAWADQAGYVLVWPEGIPDFPTQQGRITGDFYAAVRQLVTGAAHGSYNLYCPLAPKYPSTAYFPDARIERDEHVILVFASPSSQKCPPSR
jgi:hypothetical protein